MFAKAVFAFCLAFCFLATVQGSLLGEKAYKLGSAIKAVGLGYGVHMAPLAMILGANTVRIGHSQPPVHHKTLVHVHEHGVHGHGHDHGWH